MSVRERLHKISDLEVTQKLMQMSDAQLNEYIKVLNSFVENFPAQETKLRAALRAKDYLSISKCLSTIGEMLNNIHADDMAAECLKQTSKLKDMDLNKVEAYLTYLLASVSLLSIDIQMAVYKDEEEALSDKDKDKPDVIADNLGVVKSILAVDDNTFFLNTLKGYLQDATYKLTCVTSGMDALKYLQTHSPDLFILDIEMPKMDGYELAQKIKDNGQKAPIIFLTGNSTKECVLKAIKVGAADFIIKPISRQQVLERISKFI